MRGKHYAKATAICFCVISCLAVIGLIGVKHKTIDKKVITTVTDTTLLRTSIAAEGTEAIREYNKYNSEIELMSDGYFSGIETIKYVHEYKTSTNKILIKLALNRFSRDYEEQCLKEEESKTLEYYGNIYVTDVMVNGEKVAFNQDITELWIQLNQDIVQDQEVTISLAFHGKLPQMSGERNFPNYVEWQGNILPQMGVFSEVFSWDQTKDYEALDQTYSEIGDYKVTLLVEEGPMPLATGTLIEDQELEDGTQKYVYEAKKARDFGVYYGNKFNEYVINTNIGTTVHIYTHRRLDVAVIGARLNEVFNYYGSMLGRYPYEKFKIIDYDGLIEDQSYSGMLITDLNMATVHYERLYEGVGRQWISRILQHHPKKDAWLNTGLQVYIAKRGTTSLEGMKRYLSVSREKYSTLSRWEKERLDHLEVFYEIEEILGAEEWNRLLKLYYKQNAFKVLNSQSFIKLLLEESGQDLHYLFNTYMSGSQVRKEQEQ
ncbi:MAG: hypothetical protein ACRCW2_01520 [Cellulosilyticaceae bacterium]